MKLPVMLVSLSLLGLPLERTLAQTAEDLFQKGVHLEEVKGELEKAVEVYKSIVSQHAPNKSVTARSLLHLGKCYEKLGKGEAQKAYERVLREFADQTEVAAEARARLASMSSESRGATGARIAVQNGDVIFRKIGFAGQGRTHLARLSPDGARMLYVDRKGKEPHDGLYEVELSSGKEKRLVDGVSALTLLYFEWSPDGKNIIYKYGRAELRVISSDGGEPKTFWSSPDQKSDVYPMDWSRDGRYILCTIENGAEGALQLAILSSSGGEPRTVAKIPLAEWASYPQFSPDGKFIVGAKTVQGNTDLYVWAVNGGQEIRLTDHPAKDDSPFWSPDGRYIVFMSDREKTRDLWALSMQGAKPEGAPIRVKSNIGKNTWVTDYTQSGVLTMLMVGEGASSDLFVMPVSPMTGDPQGQLLPFAKYPTDHGLSPALSPDGKSVAYTSRKGELSLPRIFISSGNMKADEEIPTPNYFVANIEWSGDGQSLVFPGWDPEGQLGIFRVSLKDCRLESLQLAGKRGPGNVGAFLNLRWLPYANTFRFEKLGNKNKIGEVYTMDRDGKNIRLVSDKISADVWTWPAPNGKYLAYVEGRDLKVWSLQENRLLSTLVRFSEGKPYEGPAWSPDGNKVAFKDQKQLKVCSLPDSASRVLVEAGANSELGEVPWSGGLAWSHDGRIIAYSVRDLSPGSNPRSELWVVPATGGTPRKIADAPATHPRLGQILWHPSGEMIFVSGAPEDTQPRTYEHWALENFLPKRNSGK